MVTVIASKEELPTPVNNGVNPTNVSDNERASQSIKDYQEVDFHRTASCKPLPEDLFGTVNGQITKSSIKGTFFVQIDAIEPYTQINTDQNEQTNQYDRLLLTLTDGHQIVKAVTNDYIPNLSFNMKSGSKLLLTDTILIQNGVLQLTHDNTRFHYGSNRYQRPRATVRGRGNGSYRTPYEGRRNSRYDNDDGDTNFHKRPPPKNTLMDFMSTLKIADSNNENEKSKERFDKRRYNNEPNTTNHSNYQPHYPINNTHSSNDQVSFQQDGIDEQGDFDDDPTHANHRERRNPLPPRLQRAQEERSRRGTNRLYDEAIYGNDINSIYRNDATSNHSLSSLPYGNETSYPHNNIPTGHQHNSYAQVANGTIPTHLTYYQANPGSLPYNLAAIHNSTFTNQPPFLGPSYSSDHITFCYGPHYATPTYLPNLNGDLKTDGNSNPDNENLGNTGSLNDENNDSGIKSESSATEQKQTPPLVNENETNPSDEKRRDSNSQNQRIRWKVGDMCLARWIEDGEFYPANICEIHPPHCTILFRGYNNYDQVHFSDLKPIPRDQQFYPFVAPLTDLSVFAANPYYAPRAGYYPSTMDGCILMPEAPPFPFNPDGSLCMYPSAQSSSMQSNTRSTRHNTNGLPPQDTRRNENGDLTLNSTSSPSKDSNDTSVINSTTASSNDENQQQDLSLPRPCSIADAPLTLVTSDDLRERSPSTESLPSSKCDDQQSTKDDEEEPTRE
ncbi:unnamed protein product [Adineta ricciae]|uniref:Tudor domain-containing protein n=1 Tax=Adineta ricciae TaxID=249248 RepID=A0A816C219_ADIRI|nr:unnamed protein product [Adineta ricciae]CAF1616367.1 unnamed protein product [Adineta ricciae]